MLSEMIMRGCEVATDVLQPADTVALEFKVGDQVCCGVGDVKGLKGTIAAHRAEGRILVRLGGGLYVELPRFCVCRDEDGGVR
jgi:hypothetical protein